ncbi:hypothetical protein PoB_006881400 [Plakobranchus ocellatus]|uniref:Uncharacterized protein n=1 Tax=Plakobranchus ocellatus TaxID=259542 RepID=A0AAV4DDN1_9GAST|nr:hypothetical protein PoB_006881400 [Plakobranchus ocellatus]
MKLSSFGETKLTIEKLAHSSNNDVDDDDNDDGDADNEEEEEEKEKEEEEEDVEEEEDSEEEEVVFKRTEYKIKNFSGRSSLFQNLSHYRAFTVVQFVEGSKPFSPGDQAENSLWSQH